MKKVLFISISAPPKNAPESLQTAKYLKHLVGKFDITLVTTPVTGGWRPEDHTTREYLKGIDKIVEIPLWPNKLIYQAVRRLFPFLITRPDEDAPFFWRYKQVLNSLGSYHPDLIYSRSAPLSSHFLAQKLAQKLNVPWVMHLSDPWVDNPYFNFGEKTEAFHKQKEEEFFRNAAAITVTSEKTAAFYRLKYPEMSSKISVCTNVYDEDDIAPAPLTTIGKLRFVHTGRLYGTRSATKFLKAIEVFLERNQAAKNRVEFVFAGFCDPVNQKNITQQKFHHSVKYLGPVTFFDSLALQRSAHILVVIDGNEKNELFQLFFPSKLLDYMITGRKILALTGSNSTTEEVVEGKFGQCFRHDDTEGISGFLETAYHSFLEEDFMFFFSDHFPEKYSASYNAAKLAEIFESVV